MPLVRIDVLQDRAVEELPVIGDAVHRALVAEIGVPELDRFQVISRHPAGLLVFNPEYLGIHRTTGIIFVQITLSVGRTVEQKRALYAAIASNLSSLPDMRPEDIFIDLVEVPKENWSFGNGIAQYAP